MNEPLVRRLVRPAASVFDPRGGIKSLAAGIQDPRLLAQEADAKQRVFAPSRNCRYRRNAADDEMKSSPLWRRVIKAKAGADA